MIVTKSCSHSTNTEQRKGTQKLRTPHAQPALKRICSLIQTVLQHRELEDPMGQQWASPTLFSRAEKDVASSLLLGLSAVGGRRIFLLRGAFINRRTFRKSNMDSQQEIKSQEAAKITCYFQMAYGHTYTHHRTCH